MSIEREGAAAVAALAIALLGGCATVATAPTAPGAPVPVLPGPAAPSLGWFSKIKVPEGHKPALKLAARGVQVFRCEQRGNAWVWVFRVPEADLADDTGKVVARHGANFSFEHTDGSRLIGKVQSFDEAPSPEDLRWLLLTATAYGQGAFAGVTHVQRVNTKGGMPPTRCEMKQRNQLLRVDFSSDFVFFRPG